MPATIREGSHRRARMPRKATASAARIQGNEMRGALNEAEQEGKGIPDEHPFENSLCADADEQPSYGAVVHPQSF